MFDLILSEFFVRFYDFCAVHTSMHKHTVTQSPRLHQQAGGSILFPFGTAIWSLAELTGNLPMFPMSSVLQQRHLKYPQRHIPRMTFSGDAAASPDKVFTHPRWPTQRVQDFTTPIRYLKFKISPEIWRRNETLWKETFNPLRLIGKQDKIVQPLA